MTKCKKVPSQRELKRRELQALIKRLHALKRKTPSDLKMISDLNEKLDRL